MATTTVVQNDLEGVLVWIALLLIIGLGSILLYEILRHMPKFFKVFYTRLTNAKSPRLHPKRLFEWMYWVFNEKESTLLEEAGLDAIMFLRYLIMCFKLFSSIAVIVSLVIIPVNYYASSSSDDAYNITTNHGIFEITSTSLSTVSITNIDDGSNLLWIHAICVWLVSLVCFAFLYEHYRDYASTASSLLKAKKSGVDDLKQRTILISNLASNLASKEALVKWFKDMELPVEQVNLNSNDDQILMEKIAEFHKVLTKLETAYMLYAMNLYKSLKMGRLAAIATGWAWQLTQETKMYIAETKMTKEEMKRSEPFLQQCRPYLLRPTSNQLMNRVDVIKSLSLTLKKIENEINSRRAAIKEEFFRPFDLNLTVSSIASPQQLQKIYRDLQTSSVSSFVTFKTRQSAYIALQVLLHSSMDGVTMSVSQASAPSEVQWKSLTRSFMDRKIKGGFIALVGLVISILWVYPSYYISSLTLIQVDKTELQSANSNFLLFINQIAPPVLVFTSAKLAPYLLEMLSYQQSFDSTVHIDSSTLSKYFYFLMFNVHFVFTLLTSAWGTSGSFFSDPLGWVQLIAISFPDGASFFISFVILNTISFPIELLRPVPIVWYLVGRRFYTTPRDLRDFSDNNSLLNYGFLYPMHILVFIVVLCYSIISPLVILPGIVYFGSAWLVYKNQILYVYVKQSEGFGAFWLMAFKRSVLGLALFQFLTAGLISAKKANFVAVAVGALLPVTYLFYTYCQSCFAKHDSIIPLESLNENDPNIASATSAIMVTKDQEHEVLNMGQESDQDLLVVKTKSRISFTIPEKERKTINLDYIPPALSQPLPKVWGPDFISHLMETDEE